MTTPAYSAAYVEALELAATLHGGQWRKGTTVPYVSHLLVVSALVWEHHGDEQEAVAGLLHDAVEDQGGQPTLTRIRQAFGDRVADIVWACSDADTVPKPKWCVRKQHHIDRVRGGLDAGVGPYLVMAADKLHNAWTIIEAVEGGNDAVFESFKGGRHGTAWYYLEMHEALSRQLGSRRIVELLGEAAWRIAATVGYEWSGPSPPPCGGVNCTSC